MAKTQATRGTMVLSKQALRQADYPSSQASARPSCQHKLCLHEAFPLSSPPSRVSPGLFSLEKETVHCWDSEKQKHYTKFRSPIASLTENGDLHFRALSVFFHVFIHLFLAQLESHCACAAQYRRYLHLHAWLFTLKLEIHSNSELSPSVTLSKDSVVTCD